MEEEQRLSHSEDIEIHTPPESILTWYDNVRHAADCLSTSGTLLSEDNQAERSQIIKIDLSVGDLFDGWNEHLNLAFIVADETERRIILDNATSSHEGWHYLIRNKETFDMITKIWIISRILFGEEPKNPFEENSFERKSDDIIIVNCLTYRVGISRCRREDLFRIFFEASANKRNDFDFQIHEVPIHHYFDRIPLSSSFLSRFFSLQDICDNIFISHGSIVEISVSTDPNYYMLLTMVDPILAISYMNIFESRQEKIYPRRYLHIPVYKKENKTCQIL